MDAFRGESKEEKKTKSGRARDKGRKGKRVISYVSDNLHDFDCKTERPQVSITAM